MIARSRSPAAALLLLLLGGALWATVTHCDPGPATALYSVPIMMALAAAAKAWQHRRPATLRAGLHGQSPHLGRRATLAALAAFAYFLFTAWSPGRDLFPKYHDEFVYLIQARMLLRGRLWMPPIPPAIAPFFDNHYLILSPVYAAQYWPGEAMLLAIGLAAHVPPFVLSCAVSAAVVGLFHWIVARVLNERLAPLAALMLVAVATFRQQSVYIGAMGTVMLAGMLMVAAWLKWRRGGRIGWAMLLGAAAGWGAITRPVDALCYAIPLGVAAMIDAKRGRPRVGGRKRILAVLCAAAAAAPFIAVQLVFDRGVTGNWFEPPFVAYARRDFPQVQFGFPGYDPTARPQSHLAQKQILYQQWAVPYVISHQLPNVLRDTLFTRIPLTLTSASPHPLLLVLVPVGLLGLGWRRHASLPRWAVWLALPLFVGLYGCYTFFLSHYPMVVAPALILTMLMGLDALRRAWPGMATRLLLPAAVAGLAIAALPQLTRVPEDPNYSPSVLMAMQLPHYIRAPAIVLFRFDPSVNNVHDEPVFNADTAWPDDAPIIRAHDLGRRADAALFRYYAVHQPQRTIYQFNQATGVLRLLGTAAELGAGAPAGSASIRLSP